MKEKIKISLQGALIAPISSVLSLWLKNSLSYLKSVNLFNHPCKHWSPPARFVGFTAVSLDVLIFWDMEQENFPIEYTYV